MIAIVQNHASERTKQMQKSIQAAYDAITNIKHEMNIKDSFINQLHDEMSRLNSIIARQTEIIESQRNEIGDLALQVARTDTSYVTYIENEYREVGRECDLLKEQLQTAAFIYEDKSNTIRIKDETISKLRMENHSYKSEIGSLKTEIDMKNRELASHKWYEVEQIETCVIDPAMFEKIPGFTGFASCGNGCAVIKTENLGFTDHHEDSCPESDEYDFTL